MTAWLPGDGVRKKLASVGAPALCSLLCALGVAARAQLSVLPEPEPKQLFPGKQLVNVLLSNRGSGIVDIVAYIRLIQTTSATAVSLGEFSWKQLQVLPGQTLLETATVDFPAVNAETRFVVQWLENTNRLIGQTEVRVHPTNLLAELEPLAGESPPGLFDPEDQLKPLLKQLAVEFIDLENTGCDRFTGRLAIVGPFRSMAQMRERLADGIAPLTKKHVGVVWIQPPTGLDRRDKLRPSFYSVPHNRAATVVVQPELLAGLAGNPQSQLHLIYFCKLALHPEPPRLPSLPPEP